MVKIPPAIQETAYNEGDVGLIPGSERSAEKEMTIYSNIFVWKILWTEEPGGLQSMGTQRVGHDLVTKALLPCIYIYIIATYIYNIYNCLYNYIGEGNGTPLQYSCLENPMGGGAW